MPVLHLIQPYLCTQPYQQQKASLRFLAQSWSEVFQLRMRWLRGRNRWPGSQSQRGMWQLLLSPILEKKRGKVSQAAVHWAVGHCRSSVSFSHSLLKCFTVKSTLYVKATLNVFKVHSCRETIIREAALNSLPANLSCWKERHSSVVVAITPPNSVCVGDP